MRSSILLCLVPVALCAAASPSPANVTISNASTANMTCSGGVCSPTAADAVLNVLGLEAMLASGNTTVTTTGTGVQATDIHVDARLTWSAGTTLALDAFRSIEVNRKVTVSGAGGASLTTNDGGSGGDFACNDNGAVTFTNMSSKLTVNGTAYTLVNSVASLATAIAANPSGAFALATNYNAKKDGTYVTSPVSTTFGGSFNGLGNMISNLSVNDPTEYANDGLFAETSGTIANVRLVNENVRNSNSVSSVGGLVGGAKRSAIAHSFTSGTVSSNYSSGGLVGSGESNVTASGSEATVSGAVAGGLVGDASAGLISDSWATGNVSGSVYVGGLVGSSQDTIKHSRASGQVSAELDAGGLVGEANAGSIERSYASGAVACQGACGGLAGYLNNVDTIKISQSYAIGATTSGVTYGAAAGGLIGSGYPCDTCEIVNSYATGAVSGWAAGGLVGQNGQSLYAHSISASYSIGTVSGTTWAGGLIGGDFLGSNVKRTYWDMTTSGITDPGQGAGYPANDPGIKGLSDKKLKSGLPDGFNPKIWAESPSINGGLPYLIANPPQS